MNTHIMSVAAAADFNSLTLKVGQIFEYLLPVFLIAVTAARYADTRISCRLCLLLLPSLTLNKLPQLLSVPSRIGSWTLQLWVMSVEIKER